MGSAKIEKELALQIIELLSAMEFIMIISRGTSRTIPDYLHENLADIVDKLRIKVLE